jgi:hypothetical protein
LNLNFRLKLSRMLRLLTIFLLLVSVLSATPRHAILMREAAEATKAGDHAAALVKLEEAAQLRPDYPRLQLLLARTYAKLNRPADTLAALQRLADMELKMNVAADPAFAALKESPDFQAVASRLTQGPVATTTGETALTPPGVTGIIESCLFDPAAKAWYFGDVRNRCIWQHDPGTGSLRKFTSDEDVLDGVFKLALSADGKTLWAATATVGVMTGADAEDGKRTLLGAIDPATGRVRTRHPVPADGRKHLLGDFIIAADGSLYATDSWCLPPNGDQLEPWLESDQFMSLQGIAFGPDGRTLFVADYANGIWRIDPATKTPALLKAPANATFFGIDGIYAVPGGLLAVQNGVNPQRVLRIEPATGPSSARIVALGQPAMTDLALGTLHDGRFYFVGDSGWALFDPAPATPPPARTVTVHSISLP